jgi:hypothetical protein
MELHFEIKRAGQNVLESWLSCYVSDKRCFIASDKSA